MSEGPIGLPGTRLVLLTLLLGACSKAPSVTEPELAAEPVPPEPPAAEPSAESSPVCAWTSADGLVTGPGYDPVTADVAQADVDGREPADLIANLGACGNWGDCEFVVLVACPDGGYRAVWGPEYAQFLDVRPRGDAQLAPLAVQGRTAMAGCDLMTTTVLQWADGAWQAGETCAGSGVWDDEACGDRPPPCP